MKKVISVLLCIILAASCALTALAADDPISNPDYDGDPVVFVAGYSSSELRLYNDDGTSERVWWLDSNEQLGIVYKNIADIALDAGYLAMGDASKIADTFVEKYVKPRYVMKCNPDGTSVNNVDFGFKTAEEANCRNIMLKYPDDGYIYEPENCAAIAKQIGYEHIFMFNCDFRMTVLDAAAQLDSLVESVRAYTGKDKVNLYAISHGGQVVATYLALYGSKDHVNNVEMNVPAIGGAGIAWDAMNDSINFDFSDLVTYCQNGFVSETDYDWLVKANQFGTLQEVIKDILPSIKELIKNWGSIWDFIPAEKYDEFRAQFADDPAYAQMLANSDKFHYDILANMGSTLRACKAEGMNITIIAGCGDDIITGYKVNSDGIIPVNASTGALCAPYGQRFSDGYVTAKTSCADETHDHLSPSMEIDASTAWLPDNTWFVDGFYHGMEYKDVWIRELMLKQLLTDDITSVYDDPQYPQFHAATNASLAVFAAFDKSAEGYLSKDDTGLIVKNISEKYPMKLLAVNASGIDIDFNTADAGTIQPGGTVKLTFSGKVPGTSLTRCAVTVTYSLKGNSTPVNERTFDFTIMNGAAAAYDASEPYSDVNFGSGLTDLIGEQGMSDITLLGLRDMFVMIYNIFARLIKTIGSIMSSFGVTAQ